MAAKDEAVVALDKAREDKRPKRKMGVFDPRKGKHGETVYVMARSPKEAFALVFGEA